MKHYNPGNLSLGLWASLQMRNVPSLLAIVKSYSTAFQTTMDGRNRSFDDPSLLESVVKQNSSRQKTWSQTYLSTWNVGAMSTCFQTFGCSFFTVLRNLRQVPESFTIKSCPAPDHLTRKGKTDFEITDS